jgi:hypothetical protein
MKNKVLKSLSPEEATIVSNIQSLLAQLTQGGEGEAAAMANDPMAEGDEDEIKLGAAMVDDDEEVDKGLETTPSDGSVAGDPAEAAFEEELPDSTAANAKSVAKAILDMIQPASPTSDSTAMIAGLTQVVQKAVERQTAMETTVSKLLEGLGVAKQLELRVKEERRSTPIVSNDNAAVMKALSALIANSQPTKADVTKSMHEQARDNLGTANVLAALVGAK